VFKTISMLFGKLKLADIRFWRVAGARVMAAALIGGIFLLIDGCSKKPQSQSPPSPPTATQPASATPPAPTLVQANGQVDLAELRHVVVNWVMANHRRPATFEEFTAWSGIAVPPPPPGKKYSLGHGMVVTLVNQ
jgi:hypothetical protein